MFRFKSRVDKYLSMFLVFLELWITSLWVQLYSNATPSRNPTGEYIVPQLFRQAWNEIPEVMGAGVFALIGCCILVKDIYQQWNIPGRKYKKFKLANVVYRPDDPYVKYLYNRDTPEEIAAHQQDLQLYTLSPYNR